MFTIFWYLEKYERELRIFKIYYSWEILKKCKIRNMNIKKCKKYKNTFKMLSYLCIIKNKK